MARSQPRSAAKPLRELPDGVNQIVVFGTARNADMRIPDPYVSPHHCAAVQADDGRVFVQDLGSTNGTWIIRHGTAERVLGMAELLPGDILMVGRTHLPWTIPQEAPQ
jgi:pSer/pThr/pTyr-binding forkhead associated (FHA) protein